MKKRDREAIDKILDDLFRDKNRLLTFHLAKYSLGTGQFQILNLIAFNQGISQDGIAKERHVDKSAIGKSIKGLIDNDYIYKIRDINDKRAFCLYCTDKGKTVVMELGDVVYQVDQLFMKDSSIEEVELFRTICKRISNNIECFLVKDLIDSKE